jgi:hypothetical protein
MEKMVFSCWPGRQAANSLHGFEHWGCHNILLHRFNPLILLSRWWHIHNVCFLNNTLTNSSSSLAYQSGAFYLTNWKKAWIPRDGIFKWTTIKWVDGFAVLCLRCQQERGYMCCLCICWYAWRLEACYEMTPKQIFRCLNLFRRCHQFCSRWCA